MAEPKKRRGRPAKKEEPKEEKPVYSHESKIRCTAYAKSHPRFLDKRCDYVMKADGTTQGGKIKIWVCPKCGRRTQTEGKLI
jgi:hypothetical protein